MGKRFLIFLIAISMVLLGSVAIADDGWQKDFAGALGKNNLNSALRSAFDSEASAQEIYDALDDFGVKKEEIKQDIMLIAKEKPGKKCTTMCDFFRLICCDISPSGPHPPECAKAEKVCRCECDSS